MLYENTVKHHGTHLMQNILPAVEWLQCDVQYLSDGGDNGRTQLSVMHWQMADERLGTGPVALTYQRLTQTQLLIGIHLIVGTLLQTKRH